MFRWVEHTGELELEVEAHDEQAVFADAASALGELLGDEDGGEAPTRRDDREETTREVAVEAPDRPRLLADFVTELAFLAESEGFVAGGLQRAEVDEGRVRATVRGRIGEPPHLVKAVTYHRLRFEAVDGGWRARVVLDV